MRVSASRSSGLRMLGLVLLLFGPCGAHAAGRETSSAVGVWELKLDNDLRKCRLMLRADAVPPGHGLGMPPGCRLAFPFMTDVTLWREGGDGKVRFDNAQGDPVLSFEPGEDGVLSATGPQGEALRLAPLGRRRDVGLKRGTDQPVGAVKSVAEMTPAPKKAKLPTMAEMAGHYAVLRKLGKDTGCMVTLDDKASGPKGSLKANLAPACRDQGIVIFDPVGWQLHAGRLVLTARKGHTTELDLQDDGSWTKDAKEGANLSLKKM